MVRIAAFRIPPGPFVPCQWCPPMVRVQFLLQANVWAAEHDVDEGLSASSFRLPLLFRLYGRSPLEGPQYLPLRGNNQNQSAVVWGRIQSVHASGQRASDGVWRFRIPFELSGCVVAQWWNFALLAARLFGRSERSRLLLTTSRGRFPCTKNTQNPPIDQEKLPLFH